MFLLLTDVRIDFELVKQTKKTYSTVFFGKVENLKHRGAY